MLSLAFDFLWIDSQKVVEPGSADVSVVCALILAVFRVPVFPTNPVHMYNCIPVTASPRVYVYTLGEYIYFFPAKREP